MAVAPRGLRAWLLACLAPAMLTSAAAGLAFADPMSIGGSTSQPIGHYDFCTINRAECTIRPRHQTPIKLTEPVLELIMQVNLAVNREVTPMSDMEIYGREEVWTYPDAGVGDCEDYVLEKRRRLSQMGVPLANLLITVVRKPDGEGHAVLTVRTDQGDFILDNLNNEVKHWRNTKYRFLKRQASHHTGRWVSLLDDQNMLVGAVNSK